MSLRSIRTTRWQSLSSSFMNICSTHSSALQMCPCTGLLPFTRHLSVFAVKSIYREQQLLFHSLTDSSIIIYISHMVNAETFISYIWSHYHPPAPCVTLALLWQKHCVQSQGSTQQQMIRIPVMDRERDKNRLWSLRLMFKKCREHVERSAGGWRVAESWLNS